MYDRHLVFWMRVVTSLPTKVAENSFLTGLRR